MSKVENKLVNFTAANKRLKEAVTAYKSDKENSLYRDALIQRFEFTFELAWKTTAEVLRGQGIVPEILSPKSVFRVAYNSGYITKENIWLDILNDRNSMSHTYDEQSASRIADDICNRYAKEINALLKALKQYE